MTGLNITERVVSRDGKTIDVSITVSPPRMRKADQWRASKTVRDISEDKRRDAFHRDREERFRLAMNNVASGVAPSIWTDWSALREPGCRGHVRVDERGAARQDNARRDGLQASRRSPLASDCPGLQILQKGVELREQEDMFIRKDGRFFPVVAARLR